MKADELERARLFFVFMTNSFFSDLQNITPLALFLVGLVIKSPFQWRKTDSEVLNTLQRDFEAMKTLYDAKVDEISKKDEQYLTLREDYLQARARVTSYENFLQTRTVETDKILKQVPAVLEAVAQHLNVPIDNTGIAAHQAAHSQEK